MQLDFVPSTQMFTLRVPRASGRVEEIMQASGWDFSQPASTVRDALLFTPESYAAAEFFEFATERAAHELQAINHGVQESWRQESGAHIKCPADQELWPFQKAGIEYALRRRNTLIGDQPGLGKTAQAICFANEIAAKRVLVLCPANIRLQWAKNIRRWTTMAWPYVVYPILRGGHGVHPSAAWTVVSYDLARTPAIAAALAKGIYDLLVLDEAHYCKTIDAGRTRSVFGGGANRTAEPLASRAGAILALTGTPLPNRPREAYTLARGLCWDSIDMMSEDSFTRRFNPTMRREKVTADGRTVVFNDERTGRHGELQARLRSNFMVRRQKRDVLTQLKLPVFDIVQVEETAAIKQALAAESMLEIDPENLEGADAVVLGDIATVRRLMGVAIAPQAADYVEMVLDGGEDKIVLFAYHHQVMDILEARLRKYGVVRVDGAVSPQKKQKLVDLFRTEKRIRVFLGQMVSVGTGTDGLQDVCSHAIFAEADWVPGNNQQAVDRLDRGGQTRTVQADFLVAAGSFSERVLATALRKLKTTHAALDKRERKYG